MPAFGLEAQFKIGKYLAPRPEHAHAVARRLFGEYLCDRDDVHPNYGYGPQLEANIIRVQIGHLLHAFRPPTVETILNVCHIGCTNISTDGDAFCKVWLFCPEDVEHPERMHTIVLPDVPIPLEQVQVGQAKQFSEIMQPSSQPIE